MKIYILLYFLACEGLSNDGAGLENGAVFQELRPGAGFETGDFVKYKLGGLPQNDAQNMFCIGAMFWDHSVAAVKI